MDVKVDMSGVSKNTPNTTNARTKPHSTSKLTISEIWTYLRHKRRPWTEFFSCKNFKCVPIKQPFSRFGRNWNYFIVNYLLVVGVLCLLCALLPAVPVALHATFYNIDAVVISESQAIPDVAETVEKKINDPDPDENIKEPGDLATKVGFIQEITFM